LNDLEEPMQVAVADQLHVLDAVVELPAHLLREGGGEGLEAFVHEPGHHRAPSRQGRHVA